MPPKPIPSAAAAAASSSSSSSGSSSSSSSGEEEREEQMSSPPPKKPLPKKPSSSSAAAKPDPIPSPNAPKSTLSSSDDEDEVEEDEEESGVGAGGGGGDSGSDSDSDSDSDAPSKPGKPNPKVSSSLPKPPPSDSESDSESDSDDASPEKPTPPQRPSRGPDPSIKPISSKPMDDTSSKPQKPPTSSAADKPKPTASEAATEKRKRKVPEAASGAVEEEDAADRHSGKKLFQRVWTEEDEIAVLKGMIEYQAKHGGAFPSSPTEIGPFHEFIRKALHVEFSKNQLSNKIRRLRKKYGTNVQKGRKGADPSFTKAHEKAAFELSKKIWAGKKGDRLAAEDGDGSSDEMEVEAAEEEEDSGKKGRQNPRAAGIIMALPRKARSGPATPRVAASAPVSRERLWMNGEDGSRRGDVLYPKLKEVVAQLESENADMLMKGSFKRALELLKPSKAKALEDSLIRQCKAEMKVFFGRTELMKELVGALVKAFDAETS